MSDTFDHEGDAYEHGLYDDKTAFPELYLYKFGIEKKEDNSEIEES